MVSAGNFSKLEGDFQTLQDLGVKYARGESFIVAYARSNDLLLLDDMSFSKQPSTNALPAKAASKRLTINKRGDLVEEALAEPVEVEEDPIDKLLAKEDGWIASPQSDSQQKTMKIDDLGIAVRACIHSLSIFSFVAVGHHEARAVEVDGAAASVLPRVGAQSQGQVRGRAHAPPEGQRVEPVQPQGGPSC